MRSLFCILFVLLAIVQIQAQNEYISNSRDAIADRPENLDGRRGVLVLSDNSTLVIRVTNASRPVEVIKPIGKNRAGEYEYKLIMDADDTDEAKVVVSRMSDLYTTEFVARLKRDTLVAYRIQEVEEPIRFEDQTRGNDAHLNALEAELEFSTIIKGLTVKCSDKLGASISSKPSAVDPNVTVTTVVLPVTSLVAAREELKAAQAEYDRLTALVNSDKATLEDLDRHDDAEKRLSLAEATMAELSTVKIYSERTNHLSIDISSLGPRSKKVYVVLPITIEKEVFVTECNAYMTEGGRLFGLRKYADARVAFVNAIGAKDVPLNMKPAIMENISRCDSCIQYEKLAAFAIGKIMQMKKDGTATQQQVKKYAEAAIDFLGLVNEYNPSDFYTSRIEKLEQMLEDLPLNVAFTVVEWLTVKEGSLLPNVEIWAYYGMQPLNSADMASPRKLRKVIDRSPGRFRQVGLTDAEGRNVVVLDRKNLPTAFVFCPSNDDDIKITLLTMGDLMRQASGTYLERQFRLKMYKRTNKYF